VYARSYQSYKAVNKEQQYVFKEHVIMNKLFVPTIAVSLAFVFTATVNAADNPELNLTDNPETNTDETFVSIMLKIDPAIAKGDTFYKAIDVCGEKARPVEVIGPVVEDSENLCMPLISTCPLKIVQIPNLESFKPDLKFQVTYDPPGDWNNNELPKDYKFIARCLPIFSEDLKSIDAEVVVANSTRKTVFVTSETYTNRDLGGFSGADAKCNALAQKAGLFGTFKALFSLNSRFGHRGPGSIEDTLNYSTFPYVRVDGVIIADNHEDLFDCSPDCLKASINVDENRKIASYPFLAWTGRDCNLSDSNNKTWVGSITSTTRRWHQGGQQSCGSQAQAHLYCFQQ
jgi:hypothetical protein